MGSGRELGGLRQAMPDDVVAARQMAEKEIERSLGGVRGTFPDHHGHVSEDELKARREQMIKERVRAILREQGMEE